MRSCCLAALLLLAQSCEASLASAKARRQSTTDERLPFALPDFALPDGSGGLCTGKRFKLDDDDVLPGSARACPGPQPCLAWNVSLPHPVSGSVALSPTGEAVFVLGGNSTLYGLRALDGARLWEVPLPCGKQYGCPATNVGPVATEDAVFAAAEGGVLAVSQATGAVLWRVPFPTENADDHVTGQPLLAPQGNSSPLLIVPTQAQGVLALDAASGAQRWAYAPPMSACLAPTLSPDLRHVYTACNGQTADVLELGLADGSPRTVFSKEPAGIADGGVAVSSSGDTLFFGWLWAGNGHLVAVGAQDGTQHWGMPTKSYPLARPLFAPALAPPFFLIATDFGGKVYRLDPENGTAAWTVQPAKGCGSDWEQCASIEANPAFAHGGRTVLLSMMDGPNHGKVHALSTADGSERWAVEAGGSLRASTSSPVVAPGVRADRFFVAAGALPFHGGGNVVLGGAVHAFDLPPLPA